MPAKVLRLIAGVLITPVTIGYAVAFYEQLMAIQQVRAPELSLLFGITAYLAVHVLAAPPTRAYVFGHELVHATATWVSGGEVKGFHAGAKKGAVKTDKVTAFIALAPYLVPVYSIVWALFYGAAGLLWDMKPWTAWFFFGLGATLAFHLVFTVTVLKEKQPDLEVAGPVISLNLITWGNITFVIGVMSLMIQEVRFWPYLTAGFQHTHLIYRFLLKQLFAI